MAVTPQDVALLITAVTPLVAAVFSGIAMVYSIKNHSESSNVRNDIAGVKENVQKIETATNSNQTIMQAASFAAGKEAQRAEQVGPSMG
jgi:hypothetical protein